MYPSAKGEELLRLGVTFGMPAAYDRVEYLGLGPWDNYRDRRTSCWKDIFRTSVDDMFFAYSRPQDMGNRMETDWIALSKPQEDQALWVGAASPRAPLEVSVLRYTPKELNDARSLDRLPEKNKVIVNLDAFQMGLGGSSCGPRPLVKYQTLSGATALGFVLAPSSALLNLARTGLAVPHSPVIERDGGRHGQSDFLYARGGDKVFRQQGAGKNVPESLQTSRRGSEGLGCLHEVRQGSFHVSRREEIPPRQGAGRMENSKRFFGRAGYRFRPFCH